MVNAHSDLLCKVPQELTSALPVARKKLLMNFLKYFFIGYETWFGVKVLYLGKTCNAVARKENKDRVIYIDARNCTITFLWKNIRFDIPIQKLVSTEEKSEKTKYHVRFEDVPDSVVRVYANKLGEEDGGDITFSLKVTNEGTSVTLMEILDFYYKLYPNKD